MAEKSGRPRASASLGSARPMRHPVGRARIVSAPMRTCSCAMVVPPEHQSRHAGLGHAVPRPQPILTQREKTCSPQRRQIGMAPPPAGRPLRFVRETSDMVAGRPRDLTPPTTRSRPGGSPWRPRETLRRAEAVPATSMIALAIGAAAFGAVAVGALAIGRLALGRVTVKKARFQALEVDELTVGKLRVREYDGPPPPA